MAVIGNTTTDQITMSGGVCAYMPQTQAMWIKMPSGTPQSGNPEYFFKIYTDPTNAHRSFQAHAVVSSNGTQFGTGVVIETFNVGSYDQTSDVPSQVDMGVWHHYCATFSDNGTPGTFVGNPGSSGCNQYIDGKLLANAASGSATFQFINNISLGEIILSSGAFAPVVQMAYPAVWTSILTPAQIAQLVAQADPRKVSPSTLVAFQDLNFANGSKPDMVNPMLSWIVSGNFTVLPNPFALPVMSHYANPPKLRSYVDHKPHSVADHKKRYGRTWDTYWDHWPVDQSDIFFKPNRPYINSYIDHFARPGDQRLM